MSSNVSKVSHLHTSNGAKEEHTFASVDAILIQTDYLSHDQEHMLVPELNLTAEMLQSDLSSDLQHLIQTEMQTNESAMTVQNAAMVKDTTVTSPLSKTQAMDLSTSSNVFDVISPGEKTPPCYGEVPGFVLEKIRGEDPSAAPPDSSRQPSEKRGPCPSRVSLEKRFNSIAGSMEPADFQSVINKSRAIVLQPTESKDAGSHPTLQKWTRPEGSSYIKNDNPTSIICVPVIGQMSLQNPQKGFTIPKEFLLNFCPERVLSTNSFANAKNQSEDKKTIPFTNKRDQFAKSETSKVTPYSPGGKGSDSKKRLAILQSLRKVTHNEKERERRMRIRLCCDELNKLVPFCHADTDKVTTLQWTSAYLKYVNRMYGNTIREEFQKTFADKDGLKLKPSLVNDLLLQDPENIPTGTEP